MMAVLRACDIDSWYNNFLATLTGAALTDTPRRPTQIPLKKALRPYAPERQPNTAITPKPAIPSTTAVTSKPASTALTSSAFGITAAKSS
jgi:hypothetical protein